MIFHIKEDERGRMCEHCHVVWSRIDVAQGRAVPLSFFKEKLMTVTRAFAQHHGLELPAGYYRQEDKLRRRNHQLSAYDCIKQKQTGISHDERMAAVTDAWRHSDNGKAFVGALSDLGYILARGRNSTRLVLVDFYGHTTALTRLIDDATVCARHVREFLGAAYAPEKLPTAEQAQNMAAQRRNAIEAFEKARTESEQAAQLVSQQAARRKELEGEAGALRRRQHEQRSQLAAAQKAERDKLKAAYLADQKRIRTARSQRRLKGLAAFLGRVSGIALITRKVQRHRDRKRYGAYLTGREALKQHQQREHDALARRHELQAADMQRRLRALDQVEKRERQTLDLAALKERRQAINARHAHMPSMTPALKPGGEMAVPEDGQRHKSPLAAALARAAEGHKALGLAEAFGQASGGEGDGDTGRGEAGGPQPVAESKIEAKKQRASRRLRHFNEVARGSDDGESGGEGNTGTPAPDAETKLRRCRRRRIKLERAFNEASGAGNGKSGGDDSGGGPRKQRRRRDRKPAPDHDPPRPRRTRKRDLDRGM